MLFYNSSKYLCPCGKIPSKTHPLSSFTPRTLHRLPDLYFCPKCHILKCPYCCDVSVVCKYCANCMGDYTDSPGMTRCSKSCFECPECSSPLSVSIHDEVKNKNSGKNFHFSCVHCSYSYTTKTVSKPAPLSTILKHEQPSYFQDLHEKYTLAHKLLQLQESTSKLQKPKVSRGMLTKMKEMDIDPASSDELSEMEKLSYKLSQFAPRPVDIDADFVRKKKTSPPKGNHLAAKNAYNCNSCGTRLLSPVADARSMKYLEKELAIDVVPLVTAKIEAKKPSDPSKFTMDSDTSCVLNIVNPMLYTMNVTVSTLEHIPSEISGTDYEVSLSLPVTSVTVPARREKANVLDSIPSVYLTEATQASRGELLTRTIRREGLRRTAGSQDPFVEQGSNWVSMPFAVTVFPREHHLFKEKDFDQVPSTPAELVANTSKKDAPTHLKLPFYITVETRLPSSWTAPNKKGLKYGFWVLCDVS